LGVLLRKLLHCINLRLRLIQLDLLLRKLLSYLRRILNSLILHLLHLPLSLHLLLNLLLIKRYQQISTQNQHLPLQLPIVIRRETLQLEQRENWFNGSLGKAAEDGDTFGLCDGRAVQETLCGVFKIELVHFWGQDVLLKYDEFGERVIKCIFGHHLVFDFC